MDFNKQKQAQKLELKNLPIEIASLLEHLKGKDFENLCGQWQERIKIFIEGMFIDANSTYKDILSRQSYSCRIEDIQQLDQGLNEKALKLLLGSDIGVRANIYFSKGKKGSSPIGFHTDFYPLLVHQIKGQKQWTIQYEDKQIEKFNISAGETFFVPSKTLHKVDFENSDDSIHLTLPIDIPSFFEFFTYLHQSSGSLEDLNFNHFPSEFVKVLEDPKLKERFLAHGRKRKLQYLKLL